MMYRVVLIIVFLFCSLVSIGQLFTARIANNSGFEFEYYADKELTIAQLNNLDSLMQLQFDGSKVTELGSILCSKENIIISKIILDKGRRTIKWCLVKSSNESIIFHSVYDSVVELQFYSNCELDSILDVDSPNKLSIGPPNVHIGVLGYRLRYVSNCRISVEFDSEHNLVLRHEQSCDYFYPPMLEFEYINEGKASYTGFWKEQKFLTIKTNIHGDTIYSEIYDPVLHLLKIHDSQNHTDETYYALVDSQDIEISIDIHDNEKITVINKEFDFLNPIKEYKYYGLGIILISK